MLMFNFDKEQEDYEKCHRVLRSCRTLSHVTVALCMIHNYGRAYGYNAKYEELNVVGSAVWYFMVPDEEFETDIQCREIGYETSMLAKGKSMWIKRYL